jgi:hypothetical protein
MYTRTQTKRVYLSIITARNAKKKKESRLQPYAHRANL